MDASVAVCDKRRDQKSPHLRLIFDHKDKSLARDLTVHPRKRNTLEHASLDVGVASIAMYPAPLSKSRKYSRI